VSALAGCQEPARPAAAPAPREVAWRSLGSWSGRGNSQIASFTSDTGSLRVRWETRNESSPGAGRFHLTLGSAISGRSLAEPVDHRGVGKDTAYVRDDPRVYFAVVESADVDWSFTIEEAVSLEP
jgi:hypothetical protein